ncbi:MAG TPA: segregation/condensation protein A [Candidatus Paceibacterota bacterium]
MESTVEPTTIGEHRVKYHLKTEQFEGPLDLLLTLIEKRKLFIGDFALAKVADEYIAEIRRFEAFPMNDVANFLLVASTLVLIKSKSILPDLNLDPDEESDIDDLKRRLAMYELFRGLAQHIRTNFGRQIIFERSSRPEVIPVFTPEKHCSAAALSQAMRDVLAALPKNIELPRATVKKIVSIEEMMSRLATRVTQALKTSFSQFSKYKKGGMPEKEERIEIIISFLAMLELVKQGAVHVTQQEEFGDIDIETHKLDTPQYA